MITMFTIILVFLFFVLAIPLGLATLGFLFQEQGEAIDPEWELYQQRYD
jgi:preprotein translocase subunit SecG